MNGNTKHLMYNGVTQGSLHEETKLLVLNNTTTRCCNRMLFSRALAQPFPSCEVRAVFIWEAQLSSCVKLRLCIQKYHPTASIRLHSSKPSTIFEKNHISGSYEGFERNDFFSNLYAYKLTDYSTLFKSSRQKSFRMKMKCKWQTYWFLKTLTDVCIDR